MQKPLIWALALLAAGVASAASAASGTVLRDEKLYTQPSSTAAVAGSVARGTNVTIQTKQGGWLRVTSGKTTGWIRLLSVRAGEGGLGGAGIGDVVGAATTKSDPSRVVAVAGLRGLNDEDLKKAKFNPEELARMDAQGVSAAQAKAFAGQSGLAAIRLPELPDPKPAQPASQWGEN
jgi:hypothetical protein